MTSVKKKGSEKIIEGEKSLMREREREKSIKRAKELKIL